MEISAGMWPVTEKQHKQLKAVKDYFVNKGANGLDAMLFSTLKSEGAPLKLVKTALKSLSSEYKSVGESNAKTILEEAKKTGSSEKDCEHECILEHLHFIKTNQFDSIKGVKNLLLNAHKKLLSFCETKYPNLYQAHEKLKELDKNPVEKAQVEAVLRSINDKTGVKIRGLSVKIFLDQLNKTEFTLDDCRSEIITKRPWFVNTYEGFDNYYFITNLQRFDAPALERIVSFCAKHVENIFDKLHEKTLTEDNKQAIRELFFRSDLRSKAQKQQEPHCVPLVEFAALVSGLKKYTKSSLDIDRLVKGELIFLFYTCGYKLVSIDGNELKIWKEAVLAKRPYEKGVIHELDRA